MTTEAGHDLKAGATAAGDFEPEQKRYLEGLVAGLQIAKSANTGARGVAGAAASVEPIGPDAAARKAQDRVLACRRQAVRSGKVQARGKSARHLRAAQSARRQERISQAAGQFPLALFRIVLCGAQSKLLHVPAAHAERHPQGASVRRRRRSRRALRWRLRACHHARQSAGARDRIEERRRHDRGRAGPGPVLARLRRRQHPQRHRHADRRHRPAGTDRHASLCARVALPHPQRALALRPAAQVQRRLRRRRHRAGAGGHQRYRLSGRAGE